jgi:hypothetical protein
MQNTIVIMKKLFCYKYLFIVLVAALALGLQACKKDKDGRPDIKAGNPVAENLSPSTASGGTMLTLTGTGLGDMKKIVFDKDSVPVGFYPTLNTDNAIVFRVPDTVSGGAQNIVLTNSAGKTLLVPFTGLAFPSVSKVSNYDFVTGTELTLTGNNLETVSKVVLNGTTDEATVVSKSKKRLVIKMPATTVARAALNITNVTGTTLTTQEFVNLNQAYQIFTDDYGAGFGNASWGDAAFISTAEFKSGTKSLGKKYAKGNWHLIGIAASGPGIDQDPAYKFLTVWVKGASRDYSLYITTDKTTDGGWNDFPEPNKINVPANVWTYFKIPLSTLNLWAKGTPFKQIGFRIQGPDAQDETFYIDDLLLVK